MSLFEEVMQTFGPKSLSKSLFYQHSPALRFELAGGDTAIAQFLQAIDRARALLAEAFAPSKSVVVLLQVWDDVTPVELWQPTLLWQRAGASLKKLGLGKPIPELQVLPAPDGQPLIYCVFSLARARLPELLWGVFAADLGLSPSLSCRLTLAAPPLGVLACPYDSRGMDFIGPNGARLAQLYHNFNDWLLDHDRERMEEMFAKPA